MTCTSLTHLKLSRCDLKLSDIRIKFPNLVCLEFKTVKVLGGSEDTLIVPFLKTLKLDAWDGEECFRMESPKLENLSIHLYSSSVSFIRFNLNQIYRSIKHLCLNGISLVALAELCQEPERRVQQLKLQSLMIRDSAGKFSVKHLSCVLCLSPNLYELEIDATVEVDESDTMELVSFLSNAEIKLNGALGTIRTVRLRKFKGSISEMCCIKFLLAHSPKLERMIVRSMNCNPTEIIDHLTELTSFPRVSPKAVIKYYS